MLFVLFSACSLFDSPPSLSDYDQSCEIVDDCVPVLSLGVCNCSCDRWVGINVDDAELYEEDRDRFHRRNRCTSWCDLACFAPPDESAIELSCDAGQCMAEVTD